MKHFKNLGIILVGLSMLIATQTLRADGAASGITLHVGPAADGRPNAYTSLAAARDAIREHRAKGEWKDTAIVVQIDSGVCYLNEPFILGPDDGGTKDAPVIYTTAAGDNTVISGGKVITGFKPVEVSGKQLWAADIPEVKAGQWNFRQLFVNNQRRPRTRLPKEGFFNVVAPPGTSPYAPSQPGQTEAGFNPGNLKKWDRLQDVEITAFSLWVESHLPIADVDEANHVVKFANKSVFSLADGGPTGNVPSRYYVENVFEALDTPGQWYLNRQTGTLYYMPKPGETPENVTIVAPRLPQIVRIEGSPNGGRVASDIYFKGLTFSHAEWSLPAGNAGDVQAAFSVPGAIFLSRAARCSITDCRVNQVSGYAIEVAAGCEDCRVANNELTDLGGGGVKIGHDSTRSTVDNNDIGDGGKIFLSAAGVWVGNSGENQITHNDIHDLYYTGVSVGWTWGYGQSKAVRNTIEYNHIHDIGKGVLCDMGGIYTLGISPGTTLRYNRIHDIAAYARGYGGWGIYNDEGSSDILVENNIVYRTTHGGYHHHYGKENKIRNNVFAFSKADQLIRSRSEPHISFFFERNIVLFSEGKLLGSNWADDNRYQIDNNVYWRTDGRAIDFAGASLDDWKKRGHDEHSLIADPLLADPAKGDFMPKLDSPALKLGFKPIDTRGIGRIRKSE